MGLAKHLQSAFLKNLENIRYGQLTVTTPEGASYRYTGKELGPQASIQVHNWNLLPAMIAKGDIGLTEAYRDGWFDTDDLQALIHLGLLNDDTLDTYIYGQGIVRLAMNLLYIINRNSRAGSKRNIAAHYDLGNDFYRLWLDSGMTYSAAIFTNPENSLEKAQADKYARMLDLLETNRGDLLEIGCGWGGFAEQALQSGDFNIRGLTLSQQQLAYGQERLGNKAELVFQDYRDQSGRFANIVSIEMFEAVGERYWKTYFRKLKSLLANRGKIALQTICVADELFDRYRRGGDMIRTFIFPGGMLPCPARFEQEIDKAGLKITDRFSFGHDYARTLEHWLENFDRAKPQIKALGFDEPFIRVWRFYLAGCAASFKVNRTDVMQYQIMHA